MFAANPAGLIGATLRYGGIEFQVIGVLSSKGSGGGFGNPDEQILVPLQTARYRVIGTDRLRTITAQIQNMQSMNLALIEIERVLRRQHHIRPGNDNDFQIRNPTDILATFEQTTQTFKLLLAGIAAVSLVVGGIGIMNIMLVSVTERTREIGVRKALGATRNNILFQFLVEALVLCLVGGILGIFFGSFGAILLAKVAGWNTLISPLSVILSFFFSALVGLFFGIWPARRAADSTEVLVWYAPDAIYFGVRAFESHGNAVRATLADRDNIDRDDRIHILLDTYFDHRRALLFAINPLGVQQDGVWSDGVDAGAAGGPSAGGRFDATIDLNPDCVYQSRGHLTPWGFEVEVRIPFKSLRYQSANPQDWGLQIERITQHSGYEDTWTPAVRANASFLIQSGKIVGLTDLHRGLVMEAAPEFTTRVEGRPLPAKYLYTGTPELGGNLRWGLTQNLNLNGTANPDFSQVEADVGQVTVNQRFALFYPEKRPFFLEGLEQFDTPNRLIYTRRITQPVAGAKLTGKAGDMNIAYLAAV